MGIWEEWEEFDKWELALRFLKPTRLLIDFLAPIRQTKRNIDNRALLFLSEPQSQSKTC